MQEDLPEITRELRKETCPPRVIDGALRRIAAEKPQRNRLRFAIPVALAAAVLLCGLLLWWRPAGGNRPRQPELVQQQAKDRARVAREAKEALNLIGALLLDASERSESVISNRTTAPLRHGIDPARNKIIGRI